MPLKAIIRTTVLSVGMSLVILWFLGFRGFKQEPVNDKAPLLKQSAKKKRRYVRPKCKAVKRYAMLGYLPRIIFRSNKEYCLFRGECYIQIYVYGRRQTQGIPPEICEQAGLK